MLIFTFNYLRDISITSIFLKSPFTLFVNVKGHLILLPSFLVRQVQKMWYVVAFKSLLILKIFPEKSRSDQYMPTCFNSMSSMTT